MWQHDGRSSYSVKGWSPMRQQSFISIPLDIPDVRVLKTELSKAGELILTVESLLNTTTCRRCGKTISARHGYDEVRDLRHLPILGHPVYLRIRPKRFRCPFCDGHPTTTQTLHWYDPQALHTKAFEQHLLVHLVNSTLADGAVKEDVSYDALLGILDHYLTTSVDWSAIGSFETMGIDEIALRKGHRDYVAVITARTATGQLHVLAVLADRLKATLSAWLGTIPPAIGTRITTVCTDMWDGYVEAVSEELPHATIVIDRFHVARHYRDAVDSLRKQELRRLKAELPKDEQQVLEKTLWPMRKAPDELSEEERARRDGLLALSPSLAKAYKLREELTTIFDTARAKADGLRRIRFWRQRVVRSGLDCFAAFLKLLDSWQDRIANYFHHRQNSGFVEGFNNKLKVLKRRCYGVTNPARLFQRLTLDTDGYRRFNRFAKAAH
jgi:transposase